MTRITELMGVMSALVGFVTWTLLEAVFCIGRTELVMFALNFLKLFGTLLWVRVASHSYLALRPQLYYIHNMDSGISNAF
jgi:hypothetical protein